MRDVWPNDTLDICYDPPPCPLRARKAGRGSRILIPPRGGRLGEGRVAVNSRAVFTTHSRVMFTSMVGQMFTTREIKVTPWL